MPDLTTILAEALAVFDRDPDAPGRMARRHNMARRIVAAIPDAEREALELGLAWLRVERAAGEDALIELIQPYGEPVERRYCAVVVDGDEGNGATPTAALTALAEALEARRG